MKWRKAAAFLVCVMLLASCIPLCAVNVSADQSYKNQFNYKISMYGEVMITGAGENMPAHLKIPSQINGYPVTIIDQMAFYNCEELVSVTLPDTIEVIWDWGFRDCDNLTSVFLGKGLSTIGEYAFMNCKKLPAFTVDKDNPNFCAVDGVLFTKDMSILWQYPNGKQGSSYTVPDGVKTIGPSSFYCCKQLTSIQFPDGLQSVGVGAFVGCDGLTTVTFPDGLRSIGDHAFAESANLEQVHLPDSVTHLGEGFIRYCKKVEQVRIPKGVTVIDKSAFSGSYISTVVIPSQVTAIEKSAFNYCTRLTTVTFEGAVGYIDEEAFRQCEVLETISLPEGLTSIADEVFYKCAALREVALPKSLVEVSTSAFSLCNIKEVHYGGTEEEWNQNDDLCKNGNLRKANLHFTKEETPSTTEKKPPKTTPWLWVVLGIGAVLVAVVAVKNKKGSD